MELFRRSSAKVYSNPRRLLGEESRATICSAVELLSGQAVDGISFAISRHKSSACWRAAGKDSPDFNAFFKALEKAADSHCSRVAVFSNKEMCRAGRAVLCRCPLDKAAAHDCDQIVRAGLLPRLFHMVNMSRVKRVVFYDDACCFQSDKYLHVHGFLTF